MRKSRADSFWCQPKRLWSRPPMLRLCSQSFNPAPHSTWWGFCLLPWEEEVYSPVSCCFNILSKLRIESLQQDGFKRKEDFTSKKCLSFRRQSLWGSQQTANVSRLCITLKWPCPSLIIFWSFKSNSGTLLRNFMLIRTFYKAFAMDVE